MGTHEVALAHVSKRFFKVVLKQAQSFPLPAIDHPAERRQALAQAILTFVRDHKVDTRRTYLCLPRAEAFFNRVLLPAAARENLSQVLEYEIEHLVPLPRDSSTSTTRSGPWRVSGSRCCSVYSERCRAELPRRSRRLRRPRGIVLASTAIADYLAFCRGESARPIGLLIAADQTSSWRSCPRPLVASQLMPASRVPRRRHVALAGARDGGRLVAPEDVSSIVGADQRSGPTLPALGDPDLIVSPPAADGVAEFFDGKDPAVLPASARRSTPSVKATSRELLPAEDRRAHERACRSPPSCWLR